MNISELIAETSFAGLTIKVSPSGGLTWTGSRATAEKWLPVLRERKAEIVAFLSGVEPDEAETIKAAALATGTPWEPPPFFIRSFVYDANMDEIYRSYYVAVLHFGGNPGATPESAMQYAVDDCRHRRDRRGKQGRLFQ